MQAQRLSRAQIAEHLASAPPQALAVALALRATILRLAPNTSEAIKFNCLSYFQNNAPYHSIGGHICMIEVRNDNVALSFIHGAELPDPHRMLCGTGKAKRFVPIADIGSASDARTIGLIKAAISASAAVGHP